MAERSRQELKIKASLQGAFFVEKIMECKHREIRVEHPTSSSCIYVGYCKKYKQYCVYQCKKKGGKYK